MGRVHPAQHPHELECSLLLPTHVVLDCLSLRAHKFAVADVIAYVSFLLGGANLQCNFAWGSRLWWELSSLCWARTPCSCLAMINYRGELQPEEKIASELCYPKPGDDGSLPRVRLLGVSSPEKVFYPLSLVYSSQTGIEN